MKNKSHVLLRIIVIAAMLVLVVAAAIECANGKSLAETAWSLLPPVIAIVLALISKEAYSSLFIGVVVGALFTTNFAPVAALDAVVNDGLIAAIADNAGIFLFLVLLGITDGDTVDDAVYLADKTVKMRVFTDENDKMNRSLADVGGGLLIVSQFTLYGDCRKGNRPSFTNAARPETAIPLYEAFIARCRESGLPVETGEFGADMKVDLLNDGPVTLWMDTKDMRR